MLSAYETGNDMFAKQVVKSFLNTLVQTLYGSTRDIKEIVRLGRLLWPIYVRPLHSSNLATTMKSVQKLIPSTKSSMPTIQSNSKQIVSFLDQQILPQIRSKVDDFLYSFKGQEGAEEKNMTSYENATTSTQLNSELDVGTSYLSRSLMLAAFICQNNRPDKDRQLFTIQKNGRKASGGKKTSQSEDLAFGSSRNSAPKGYRPRMFPMERMLSVFVSIVGLHQDQMSKSTNNRRADSHLRDDLSIAPGRTGSTDFFETLAHLRDIGVLHDRAGRGSSAADLANLSAPKFWCSLTRDEADAIARRIDFPLADYLL